MVQSGVVVRFGVHHAPSSNSNSSRSLRSGRTAGSPITFNFAKLRSKMAEVEFLNGRQ